MSISLPKQINDGIRDLIATPERDPLSFAALELFLELAFKLAQH
jgi:hypothetical protein